MNKIVALNILDELITRDSDHGNMHNCEDCQGLCCILTHIDKTDEMAEEKWAGRTCSNLQIEPVINAGTLQTYRCILHNRLIAAGWSGCDNYTCLGVGQVISTFLRSINIELGEKGLMRLLVNPLAKKASDNYYWQALLFSKCFPI